MTPESNLSREVDRVLLIADLSGYTALTEAHGSLHAAQTVSRYAAIADEVLLPGVRIVERVGDELLISGEDAASVVLTAIRLRDAVDNEPLFPTIRAGIAGRTRTRGRDRLVNAKVR